MPGQLALDQCAIADQEEADLQVPRGDERPVDDAARGVITAHGVNGYTQNQLPADSYQLTALTPPLDRQRELGARSWQLEADSWKLLYASSTALT
jgi:hypothetical protein